MTKMCRGPRARLKLAALTTALAALLALPLAAPARSRTAREAKRQAVQSSKHGRSLPSQLAGAARVRTGRARDRRRARRP